MTQLSGARARRGGEGCWRWTRRNSVADRMNAQTSGAAQFIYSHIEDLDMPWLHVDMAGPSGNSERGTGYGVALGAMLLHTLTAKALRA